MAEKLQLQLYTSPVGLYLAVHGRLDATTAHRMARVVDIALDRFPTHRITLGLAGLDAIDVAGISALIQLRALAAARGIHLATDRTPAHVRQAIHALGADYILEPATSTDHTGQPSQREACRRRFAPVGPACVRSTRRPGQTPPTRL
ncbi:STAS domain-containing protein [Catellatospora tritici]|uniref:STAS domain-containing protein n=1 Tax=Catellatospora tritici TaxID=2851566 RepID=UPI001C2D90BE|nr:STAS domain-containing protein [Catellatospora tritici]MBV1856374.1 STAS domain-containing protein [Catellatospora tritici]